MDRMRRPARVKLKNYISKAEDTREKEERGMQ